MWERCGWLAPWGLATPSSPSSAMGGTGAAAPAAAASAVMAAPAVLPLDSLCCCDVLNSVVQLLELLLPLIKPQALHHLFPRSMADPGAAELFTRLPGALEGIILLAQTPQQILQPGISPSRGSLY